MVDVRYSVPDESLLGQELASYKGKNSRRAQELAFIGLIVEKILFNKGAPLQEISMSLLPAGKMPNERTDAISASQRDGLQEHAGLTKAAPKEEGEDAVPAFYGDIDLGALRIRPSNNA